MRPADQLSCSISIAMTDDAEPWTGPSAIRTEEGRTRDCTNMAVCDE